MFIEMFPTFFFVVPPFKENPKVGPHGTHFAPHDSRFARVFRLDWLSHGPLQLTSEHLSCSCWRLTMLTWRKWVRCAIPPDVWGVCLIHPQLYHFCGIVFFFWKWLLMVKLHGFVYMFFFSRGFSRFRCCNIHFLQKKNDRINAGRRHLRRALEIKPQVGRKGGCLGMGYWKNAVDVSCLIFFGAGAKAVC